MRAHYVRRDPEDTARLTNVVLMLAQRRRRCANVKTTFVQCVVFPGEYVTGGADTVGSGGPESTSSRPADCDYEAEEQSGVRVHLSSLASDSTRMKRDN